MDTPSVKSLTSSSNSSSSNTSSSSSANSSASNERRPTPKCKSLSGEHDGNTTSAKLNFKPYELSSRKGGDGSEKSGRQNRGSPSTNNNNNNNHGSPDLKNNQHSSGASASTTTSSSSSSAPLSYTSLGLPDMHKDSLAAFYKAYGSFLTPAGCCPTTLSAAGHGHSPYGHGLMPPPITLDKTGAYPSIYPPTHSATAAAALAAYNYSNYARVKSGASGGHAHLGGNPLCRDPYCGGACSQYASHQQQSAAAMHSSHAAAAAMMAASQAAQSVPTSMASGAQPQSNGPCTPATCPNGCNQCEQQRYLAAAAMAAAYGGGAFAGLSPQMYPQMSASYANSLATAAALHHRAATAAAAAGAGGTLCNWVVGDTHCGKRFATPEELLQHLKSHTSAAATSGSGAQAHQNGVPLDQSGPHGSPPTSGSSQGHSRSSPTSANNSSAQQHHQNAGTPSPHRAHSNSSSSGGPAVSPLHSAASNRYHPYSKAPTSMAPQQQQAQPPSNGLPQSVSPYSMAQAAAAAAAAGYPFGLSPHGASMASHFPAANLYYPYMAPGLFSGRIGPPVPP